MNLKMLKTLFREDDLMSRFNEKISRRNTSSAKWDRIEGKEKLIPFSIADSDYLTAPEIEKAIKNRAEHPIYGYTYQDEEYFESIINWTKRRYGYEIDKDNIIPGNGVVTSLYYAIKFFAKDSPGVIVQPPVYNPFYDVILDNNKKVVINKLIKNDNYHTMDYVDLEKHLKAGNKVILLCSPQNPTGRVFKKEELLKVVELAKKYDAYILSDEIHCDIILGDNEFISINSFYNIYDKLIVFTSIGKTFGLAGLKTSNTIIRNKEMAEEFRNFLSHNYIGSGNVFGLAALIAGYNKSDEWLLEQNKHLTNNFNILKTFFNQKHPQVGVTKTEGTFLAWLDLSYLGIPCTKMYALLKEEGIIVAEGKKYSEDCKGYIRFNFACSEKQLLAGLEAVSTFLNKQKI